MRRWLAGAALLAAAACAQPGSPPGGEIDRVSPRVVAVRPDPFDTIRDISTSVRFRFDERLSERLEDVRDWNDVVLVSPRTGVVRVDRGRTTLDVALEGGWTPGLVYRITVLPVFRDLFQNWRREPIELVFSTGAPIEENAIAGFVTDRLTGEPVDGARLEAVRAPDSPPYLAVSDSTGFFAMRYLPAGTYRLGAWLDQDRDRELDTFESSDTATVGLAPGDTATLGLGLLPTDTTAARLASADALDTMLIRLSFDDYFAAGPVEGRARVFALPDTSLVTAGRLLHGSRLDSLEAARADTLEAVADTGEAAADTGEAAADTVGQGPPEEEALPSQDLLVVLPVPLNRDSTYLVVVEGLRNILGIPGGGGEDTFTVPAPPPDTAGVPADTLGAPADTMAPSPDAGGGPPEPVRRP